MKHSVIIIGAGISSLIAAKELATKGYTVLILEARDRPGGQIHSIPLHSGVYFEAGALYLHNVGTHHKPNPLRKLLEQYHCRTLPIDGYNAEIDKAEHTISSLKDIKLLAKKHYQNAYSKIKRAKAIRWNKAPTLEQVLGKHTTLKQKDDPELFIAQQTLTAMFEQQTGTSLNKTSLHELIIPDEVSAAHIVSSGYQHLTDKLVQDLKATQKVTFNFNTPVTEIHRTPGKKIKVVTKEGSHEATSVLCTVPAGVLKKHAIRFFPELSTEKQQALKHLGIGFQNKIYLEFEKPFWPSHVHFIYPGSQKVTEWPTYLNLYHFTNKKIPALIQHCYAMAANFNLMADEKVIEKALQPLRELYGKNVTPLKSVKITRWETDPYTLGGTTYFGKDFMQRDLHALSSSENDGLYFAGSYTTAIGRNTVRGAYLSALKASLEIDAYIKSKLQPSLSKPKSLPSKKPK